MAHGRNANWSCLNDGLRLAASSLCTCHSKGDPCAPGCFVPVVLRARIWEIQWRFPDFERALRIWLDSQRINKPPLSVSSFGQLSWLKTLLPFMFGTGLETTCLQLQNGTDRGPTRADSHHVSAREYAYARCELSAKPRSIQWSQSQRRRSSN